MDAWNSLGQSATLLNVPIFVAAGDHGCTDEQSSDQGYDGQRHADFPGTCADGIVSCGGTSLQSANGAVTNEVVWNDGDGWATGGGISTHFQIPSWQEGITADDGTKLLMRGVPDVSGNADPNTGINVRVNGNDGVSGGTSAVAPQWAALTAVLSQRLGRKAGFFIPLLYANPTATATNDIVTGDNTVFGVAGYSAKGGWDACTGLGSPDGEKLLSLLAGAAMPVAPAPGPGPSGIISPPSDGGATIPQPRARSPFDPNAALLYGQFVQSAYTMYHAEPNNLTPAQSADFPAGYKLTAWIQMQDFLIGSTGPTFYGFIAQSAADPNRFVVALRGTSNGVEWWDDANAALKTPFKIPNCGSVGQGFARIYDTLEVVERPSGAAASKSAPPIIKTSGQLFQTSYSVGEASRGDRAGDRVRTVGLRGRHRSQSRRGACDPLYFGECTYRSDFQSVILHLRVAVCGGFDLRGSVQRSRFDFMAHRQRARSRAEASAANPRVCARQCRANVQFDRESYVVTVVLACSCDLSQPDRPDPETRRGLSAHASGRRASAGGRASNRSRETTVDFGGRRHDKHHR